MASYWALFFVVLTTVISCSILHASTVRVQRSFLIFGIALILILFSGLRGASVDADSINYISWFDELEGIPFDDIVAAKDPAFFVLSLFSHALGLGIQFVFICFALVSVATKILYFKLADSFKYWHIAIYLYFCRFYFVHDMTQIRAGAAIGLASLALIFMYKNRPFLGLSIFLISILFHPSVAIFIPIVIAIFMRRDFGSRYPLLVILISSIFLRAHLDSFLIATGLDSYLRFSDYLSGSYQTAELSLLSLYFMTKTLLLAYLVLFQWSNLSRFWRLVIYLGVISIFLQIAFAQYDSLALRFAEVFSLFDVQLFIAPLFIEKLGRQHRSLYLFILFALGAIFFMSAISIMRPYQMFWS